MEATSVVAYGFGIQGLFWLALIIIFIYLIYRRIQIKKHEDFDDRDN